MSNRFDVICAVFFKHVVHIKCKLQTKCLNWHENSLNWPSLYLLELKATLKENTDKKGKKSMSFLYFRLVNTFQNFSIEAKPNNFFCQDVLALSREGQKTILLSSSTNFSPVTTQNTGTSPQNVLKFSVNAFFTLL